MLLLVVETEEIPDAVGDKKRKITRVLENCIEYPKLGEGVNAARRFSDAAMERGTEVFKKYAAVAKKHGVQKFRACATSASRDAANSKEFYTRMREQFGIDVQIICGDIEARLSFLGGLLDYQDPAKHALMDIGGGSTEFVCLSAKGELISKSTDIGSIRATELFLRGDPYPKSKIEELESGLKKYWKEIPADLAQEIRTKDWVAVAGAPTVLAAMSLGIESFTSEKIDGHRLSRCDVFDLYESLAIKTKAQRELISLVGKQRSDTIVAASAILATAMEFFEKDDVTVSTRGLRHGVLVSDF